MLPRVTPRTDAQKRADLERKLMRKEAEIGGELFGPIPKGHNRQFFCLDEHTWVWHEEWLDKAGKQQSLTTRYTVRPDGVLKIQDGQAYQRLSRDEANNLYRTVKLYRQRVSAFYQSMMQAV